MNFDQHTQKTIALAGVCQAAILVQAVARNGNINPQHFEASIRSIVLTESDDTLGIFGQLSNLNTGFSTIIHQLGSAPVEKDAEVTRYVASILGLERKLNRHAKTMTKLGDRIEQIQRQMAHLDLFDDQMMSNLASVYSDVVSPVGPKIQVAGLPALLKQNINQFKVRSLLLAGVRAAVLWRQLGGQRRQILFNRKRIVASALTLQEQAQEE